MRKLQEEDMEKTHQRAKRLADKRKHEIMTREMHDKGTNDEVCKRTQKLVDFRYRNRVSFNIHHDKFNSSMDRWAMSGFQNNKLAGQENHNILKDLEKKEKRHASNIRARTTNHAL